MTEIILSECKGCGRKNVKVLCDRPGRIKYCSIACRVKYDQSKEGMGIKRYAQVLKRHRERYRLRKLGLYQEPLTVTDILNERFAIA